MIWIERRATLPIPAHRCSENPFLPVLRILNTASQFTVAGNASKQDWMPAFEKGIAAVANLIQQLQLGYTSKSKNAGQGGADLCRLGHAVLAAISVLRKRLHSMATSKCSGAAPGESIMAMSLQLATFHTVEPLCTSKWGPSLPHQFFTPGTKRNLIAFRQLRYTVAVYKLLHSVFAVLKANRREQHDSFPSFIRLYSVKSLCSTKRN